MGEHDRLYAIPEVELLEDVLFVMLRGAPGSTLFPDAPFFRSSSTAAL